MTASLALFAPWLITGLTTGLLPLVGERGPEPEDVKAGWVAFGIWLGLAAAVVLLAFSMVKRLRNARESEAAGRYGSDPVPERPAEDGPSADVDGGAGD